MAQSNPNPASPIEEAVRHELAELKKDWWWFLLLGIALIVLGIIALGAVFYVSLVTVVFFGVLLLIGGIGEIVSSFWAGKWSGFLLHLLVGILYAVTGYLIVDRPVESLGTHTLLLAAFFIVSGAFRVVASLSLRFTNWGWTLLNGVVSAVLGILILKQLPESALWVIGLFVGIEMIFNGWSWVMLALGVKNAPLPGEPAAP